MHTPGRLDLTAHAGATFDQSLTWRIDGTLVNLTGYTARMQVRKIPAAQDAVLTLTHADGITLGGTLGTILIQATATQTGSIPAGIYAYDLELISGTTVTRLIQGSFTVTPQVTL